MHKPHTDDNEVICWHHEHATGKSIKGINLLTTFYYSQISEQSLKIPVAFDTIAKYGYCDIKSKTELRKSLYTKNELVRNQIKFS